MTRRFFAAMLAPLGAAAKALRGNSAGGLQDGVAALGADVSAASDITSVQIRGPEGVWRDIPVTRVDWDHGLGCPMIELAGLPSAPE